MKIMIINCHVNNRGDEAAVHALVDEINNKYEKPEICLAFRGQTTYPNLPANVKCICQFIPYTLKQVVALRMAVLTRGIIMPSRQGKKFIAEVKDSDIILHAPGGPSIGDTYYEAEPTYLRIYDLLISMKKRYMFYAPSMGPFNKEERNRWRRRILNSAEIVALRDPISANYVSMLCPNLKIYQTLDSALQHEIDIEENIAKLHEYSALDSFINHHDKCIGITITDLLWHPVHRNNIRIQNTIKDSFLHFIQVATEKGYAIIFIPQLYGTDNDYDLMKEYAINEHCFVITDKDPKFDTYFQQYVISKMYAVIGMRYHSNIFSAKMETPFISVSYEQKMSGFMNKMGLDQYLLTLENLTYDSLSEKFSLLEENYSFYKGLLKEKHEYMKKESCRTTDLLAEILGKIK